ncbi:TfoX family protein [bacterium]|nr:MAG: TfoX family protein [bacterium]
MGTTTEFITYLQDSLPADFEITYKKMFGEYGIYCEGKMIAMACDNQLFVKTHSAVESDFANFLQNGAPYPGAKIHFIVDFEKMNIDELSKLIQILIELTPLPKKKKKR